MTSQELTPGSQKACTRRELESSIRVVGKGFSSHNYRKSYSNWRRTKNFIHYWRRLLEGSTERATATGGGRATATGGGLGTSYYYWRRLLEESTGVWLIFH